jgi:hypothetical protein
MHCSPWICVNLGPILKWIRVVIVEIGDTREIATSSEQWYLPRVPIGGDSRIILYNYFILFLL